LQKNKIVDKHDFLNEVNKEKKSFERLLDDCVARGMDQGIQVIETFTWLLMIEEVVVFLKMNPDANAQLL
jgi:recyclin-1